MEAKKKKAKWLFALWFVLYFAEGAASAVYVSRKRAVCCYNPIAMLSGYQIFTFCIVALFFLPFLRVVVREAKEAELAVLTRISRTMLWIMSIWTVLMGLGMVQNLFFPNLF